MRVTTEWWIFKNGRAGGEYWHGDFETERDARTVFNREYRVEGKRQPFTVVKITRTPMPPEEI